MILSELDKYYRRLAADPESGIPRRHWSTEKATWYVELSREGQAMGAYRFTSPDSGERNQARKMTVPEHGARSGTGMKPFFLCDNAAYFFGYDEKRGDEKLESARELHDGVLGECDDDGAKAIVQFFCRDDRDALLDQQTRDELASEGGFVVFRLEGDDGWLHDRADVARAWSDFCALNIGDAVIGQCSITGKEGPLARLFPQVTGFPKAQSAGASLVSFNLKSFESYGKSQSYNASVSEEAAFGAGTALKMLCADREHRVFFGETMIVFWADRPAPLEDALMLALLEGDPDLSWLADTSKVAEDSTTLKLVGNAFDDMRAGRRIPNSFDRSVRFNILGLAPNAARLSVRFFEVSTLGMLERNYSRYLREAEMVNVRSYSPRLLLMQASTTGKSDDIPATLVRSYFDAIYMGRDHPRALYTTLLSRMRADHGRRNPWDMGQRAALLKACLVRRHGEDGNDGKEGLMSTVNKERTDRGYVLGRLFAVMEHAQRNAVGNPNATICDRYMGSASTTPGRVFTTLLRNYGNHRSKLRKSKPGLGVVYDKEFREIMEKINEAPSFPATLDYEEQGEFYVGFYQEDAYLWSGGKSDEDGTCVIDDEIAEE